MGIGFATPKDLIITNTLDYELSCQDPALHKRRLRGLKGFKLSGGVVSDIAMTVKHVTGRRTV